MEPEAVLPDGRYRDGKDIVFVVDGVRWSLPPLEDRDFDQLEAYLRQHRRPGVEAVKAAMPALADAPAELREGLLDRLYRDIKRDAQTSDVSRVDVAEWLDTTDGAAYSLFIQLRKRYQDMTPEKAREILRKLTLVEALKLRDGASKGLVDLASAIDQARNGHEKASESVPGQTPA